jgi:hypothetical protein
MQIPCVWVLRAPVKSKSLISIVLLGSLLLTACLGSNSNTPVIYHHPQKNITYHNNPDWLPETRIQFVVEFPDGLPGQLETRIELNGVDITADFDDWGISENNVASLALGGTYTAAGFPLVAGAIRPGANTFQVRAPVEKQLVYFQVDLGGAEIFITEWHDTYCGFAGNRAWLLPWRLNDACVVNSQPNVFTQATRHPNASVFVRGYVENNTAAGFTNPWALDINRIRINNNGVKTYAPWNPSMNRVFNDGRWGDPTAGIPLGSGENQLYGYFGSAGAMCNYYLKYMINPATGLAYTPAQYQQTTNLAVNEFCAYFPDNDASGNEMAAIEFKTTDNMGTLAQTYLRAHVPLKDSRLDKNSPSTTVAGVDARLGGSSIVAFLSAVTDTLEVSGNLISSPQHLVDIPLSTYAIRMTQFYLPNMNMNFSMSNVAGRLNIQMSLAGAHGVMQGYSKGSCFWLDFICLGVNAALGAILNQGVGFGVSGNINIAVQLNLNDSSHATQPNRVFVTVPSLNIPNMQVTINMSLFGGLLDGIINALLNAILGLLGPLIINLVDQLLIAPIIENIVNPILNTDIPKTRLVIPGVDSNGQAFKQYLSLLPEFERLTTSASLYDASERGMDAALGFHTKGGPRINKSVGSIYNDAATLVRARMARTVGGANRASAGITVSSNFINQLMMGLWESGILALDFNAGDNAVINTFLNNADVVFFSATPWVVELVDPSDPEFLKGNMKIKINDLIVAFRGDIYDPIRGRWLYDRIFLEMTVFLEMPLHISGQNGAIKIDFNSVPFAYVKDFESHYIPVNSNTVNNLLAEALPMFTTYVGGVRFNFPEVIGAQIGFKDIWVENSNNLMMTFDISVD